MPLRACAVLALVLALGACLGDEPGGTAGTTAGASHAQTTSPTASEAEPADSDSDGVADDVDGYPADASRHSTNDRDGDGTANGADVASDDRAIAAWPTGVVTHVVDGDTIDVDGLGRVRLIGIDTPEQGECGYQQAANLLTSLVLGKNVTLVPGARDDRDAYDRLLRYVDVAGKDAGRELIGAGWATARYDSRDGYGGHPREVDYVALDAHVPDRACPHSAAAPAPPGGTAAEPWNQPGPDLDCADIGRRVRITGPDHHRLDADGDGWGCESYG